MLYMVSNKLQIIKKFCVSLWYEKRENSKTQVINLHFDQLHAGSIETMRETNNFNGELEFAPNENNNFAF